ncbi:fructokinase [Nitrosomonas eutropha]|uniref:Fructokinase n=1 Tax=Nitrosomonas eutropha TaxID=916 RepID=A0A1I7G5B6_9PROT|nr:carbohydrate kinase [Nitrosomonas eutropha]SFU43662.1 fructokinase [Nitrosomonas eutropha]
MSTDQHSTPTKNIILFGEVLADIFPDGPVMGGAPFNVGYHLQAFGLCPILITRTGNDPLRQRLIKLMNNAGMSVIGVQHDSHYPTGQVQVKPLENGHEFDILADQAYDFIDSDVAGDTATVNKPQLVYFGTLAQRNPISGIALAEVLRRTPQALRLLDINLREPWYRPEIIRYSLTQADHVKVNEDELAKLPDLLTFQTGNVRDSATHLVETFQLKSLLVTRGAGGAWLLDQTGNYTETAGITNIPIIDTVGAGDGFCAVFILGLLLGWPDALTLERANRFAAALCGIRGATPESARFYDVFLKNWNLP